MIVAKRPETMKTVVSVIGVNHGEDESCCMYVVLDLDLEEEEEEEENLLSC